MKKGLRVGLLIIALLALMGTVVFVAIRLEPWLSADAAFIKAGAYAAQGNYVKAFRYIKIASDKKPGDARYAWTATQLSASVRNVNAAYFYAERAWKDGRKERDVLMALVQFTFLSDKKQRLDYALFLVNQMGPNIDKDDLSADLYESFGEFEKARNMRIELFNRNPLPALATKLGQVYLKANQDTSAFSFLQSCRAMHKLDDQGYALLARLFAKKGNLKEAETCFKEAKEAHKSTDRLEYDHALFLSAAKDFDRATFILDSLIEKYPENKSIETARISVFMAKGDFSGALSECDESSAPLSLIAPLKARILVRLNRLAEAENAYDSAVAHSADPRIHLEFGNFLFQRLNKSDKAITVFQAILKKDPTEQAASIGLASIALNKKNYAEARKRVESILALKNPTPLAYLVLGQINLLEGKPEAAIESCDKALSIAPRFQKALFMQAQACDILGKFGKADESLTTLIAMQSRDPDQLTVTKRTLVAIKIKEKKFADALALVDEIDPLKKKVELNEVRLEIYAMSGDFSKAEKILVSIKSAIGKNNFIFYQSWFSELRGDTPRAAAILASDLSSRKNALHWAMLCIKEGKIDGILKRLPNDSMKAADWMKLGSVSDRNGQFALSAQFYKKVTRLDENNPVALNNFAYASLQTPEFNRDEVLNAAKKAYLSLPDRPEVLQTYAEALNKCNMPAECIKLLGKKEMQTNQSVNLLYQLGTACEKTGDLKAAVKSYRMALAFPESEPGWPSGTTRSGLTAHIEQMKLTMAK